MTNKWEELKKWVENEKTIRSSCRNTQLGLETAYNGVLHKIEEYSTEDTISLEIENMKFELLEIKHQYENTVYAYDDTLREMTKRLRRLSFATAVYGLFTWAVIIYWAVGVLTW